jgi:signal transduction histidine kinase
LEVLGQMAAGIAHDIRSLLSVIDGALRLAERNVACPALVRKYINGARGGIERGDKLTSQLVDFSAEHVVTACAFDANELITNLVPLLNLSVGSKARINLHLCSGIPKCRVDRAQFDVALLNLVVNARDATPHGGHVLICTDCVEGSGETRERYVSISVQDAGHGMSAETLEKIFVPFFTTKGTAGTGLGLAQVRAFMDSVKGHLIVTSAPGLGTSVNLLVPII